MLTNRFEHPLNEKVRIYLRLEYLIRQMTHSSQLSDQWQHQIFFRALFDLLEILDQIQLKSELAKDLDKQRTKLKSWLNINGVDQSALLAILDNLDLAHHKLIAANRLGQDIREDRFLSGIKQRFSIPGGSCCFDLPTLHHWLHLPLAHKQSDLANWLTQLAELTEALNLWLRLTRESGHFQPQVARSGFFQYEAEDASLLRLEICPSHGVYPMISGHRNRFAIRYLPFEEGTSIAEAIEFKLAIC
ncbi:cell division protein ZapD [uncultured Photobacterium sp.]|uniref:cell division protein ZapD n=1 Tax=uncultured Photobacterium sp. TaxID=173973 RepID=UPI0026016400|nr:cell division protein ZapD [uncultured Photobacterium sp.]